jgi:hypothetical protein
MPVTMPDPDTACSLLSATPAGPPHPGDSANSCVRPVSSGTRKLGRPAVLKGTGVAAISRRTRDCRRCSSARSGVGTAAGPSG